MDWYQRHLLGNRRVVSTGYGMDNIERQGVMRARESATLVCGEYEPSRGAFELEPESELSRQPSTTLGRLASAMQTLAPCGTSPANRMEPSGRGSRGERM